MKPISVIFVSAIVLFGAGVLHVHQQRGRANEVKNDLFYEGPTESISGEHAAFARVHLFRRPDKRDAFVHISESPNYGSRRQHDGPYLSGTKNERGEWESVTVCGFPEYGSDDCVSLDGTERDMVAQVVYLDSRKRLETALQDTVTPVNRLK